MKKGVVLVLAVMGLFTLSETVWATGTHSRGRGTAVHTPQTGHATHSGARGRPHQTHVSQPKQTQSQGAPTQATPSSPTTPSSSSSAGGQQTPSNEPQESDTEKSLWGEFSS